MSKSKVWFITGASRGLGFEIAKAALESGDRVAATVRSNPEKLKTTLKNNPDLLVTVMDVTDKSGVAAAVKEAAVKFGAVDVLVNNAGYGLLSAVEEASGEEVKANYETNVFGLLNVTREVLPLMRSRRSGHVINISSVGGLTGITGWGLYGSTKFAVEGITEAMAVELAPLGIFATAVEPGFFRTDFLEDSSLTRTANVIDDYAETVGAMRNYASEISLRQPGDPVKLAKAVIRLAASEKPPVHLPLGNDTLQFFNRKMENFNKEISEWHDVITGTDHDDTAVKANN